MCGLRFIDAKPEDKNAFIYFLFGNNFSFSRANAVCERTQQEQICASFIFLPIFFPSFDVLSCNICVANRSKQHL